MTDNSTDKCNEVWCPETPQPELDLAIRILKANAQLFAVMPLCRKIELLRQMMTRLDELSAAWVRVACTAKRINFDALVAGEEWMAGPMVTQRNMRLLERSLVAIEQHGRPPLGRAVSTLEDDRVMVRVFPTSAMDAVMYRGFAADVLLEDGVSLVTARERQASYYQQTNPTGSLTLVLGAGNVSSIPPMDVLHQMFVAGHVCLLKMNPVNAWLGPFLEQIFRPFIELGMFRLVYGGAEVGAYLCRHSLVDQIHVTGSSETFDCIVWGRPGIVRTMRKERGLPMNSRPVTSELGNISPVVIVPGEYTRQQLNFMSRNVVAMIVNNASFNCNAGKALILCENWPQRAEFLNMLFATLTMTPTRFAYYPGADERYDFLTAGRKMRVFGEREAGHLPWTVITDVSLNRPGEILFSTEPFCGIVTQIDLPSDSPEDFLRHATDFCNERLWGTLSATLMIEPRLERSMDGTRALGEAIRRLRYGTVCINHWPGIGYGFVSPPWGGYPHVTDADIQSGKGWVHNTYMLEGAEKTILRGPLITSPKPAWFADNLRADVLGRKLTRFESAPSWFILPSIVATVLGG